ncbi:MAG: NlpC/P60 family protein [Sodaliphilus sp.]|nr:NlpC/P60 family protein [Sodaliphilus sp.]
MNHVGIYLKDNKFAHASSSSGVKISDITEDYFINHFYAAGRVVR